MQLHRPARHMHLQALAEEMEAQAATWQLVFCLYCDEGAPAGDGGRAVLDAGGAQLYRQRVADCISANLELSRCAGGKPQRTTHAIGPCMAMGMQLPMACPLP